MMRFIPLSSGWYDELVDSDKLKKLPLLYLHSLFDGLDKRIVDALMEDQRADWENLWWRSSHRLIEEFGWRVSHRWLENFALLHRIVVETEMSELDRMLKEAA